MVVTPFSCVLIHLLITLLVWWLGLVFLREDISTWSLALWVWDTFSIILIKVDIGGLPPIPRAQKTVFHLGIFSAVFRLPNFEGRFEALNDVF
jgi:hypothetical protein